MFTEPAKKTLVIPFAILFFALVPSSAWGEWRVRLVKDIKPGNAGDTYQRFLAAGNQAFFIAGNNFFQNYRLFRTDGSEAGTYEICPMGYYGSALQGGTTRALAVLGGDRAVFVRNSGGALELCLTDGVSGVSVLAGLGDPNDPFTSPANFFSQGNHVFFTRGTGLLWRADGTPSGTVEVKNLYTEYGLPHPSSASGTFTRGFCEHSGRLWFLAGDMNDPEVGLWTSDGTPDGTVAVWQPGADYELTGLWSTPDGLYIAASHNYYDSTGPGFVDARELWRVLPETGAAQRVYYREQQTGYHGIIDLAWLNGQVFFSVLEGQKLWRTAGGSEAVMVTEIAPPSGLPYALQIVGLTATDQALVFIAATEGPRSQLWTSDGTAGGTRILRELVPGAPLTDVAFLPFENGQLFLSVREGMDMDYHLWKTDGTDEGTVQMPATAENYSREPEHMGAFRGGYLLLHGTPETYMEPYFLYEGDFAITRQPVSPGMIESGAAARFAVEVPSWAHPWTQYQWLLNGVPITDATDAEFVIPYAVPSHTGTYTCRVTYNEAGADTTLVSNPAQLRVVEDMPAAGAPALALLGLMLSAAGACHASRRRRRANLPR